MPFAWGSPLVSHFGVFVLISLNAITNHLWNLHSWPEIKSWIFVIGTDFKTLGYQRTNPAAAAAAAKSLQSCPTLCDHIDGSPLGSPIPGILQVRTLEWVAISFSNAWKSKVKVKSLSRVRLFATPWTAAYEAPPSMGFSRQEYWSGVPLSSPIFKKLKDNKCWRTCRKKGTLVHCW